MRKTIFLILLCLPLFGLAQRYETLSNVEYSLNNEKDSNAKKMKVADIYYPVDKTQFATIIFLHGGWLSGGEKFIPEELKNNDIAVVAPNYRLSPNVKAPLYINDAAEAVAWTIKHIQEYGGDPNKIYLAGHSAGGYLALMVALDKKYLNAYGFDSDTLAGVAALSAQTTTHSTILKEKGIAENIIVIDELSPIYNARLMPIPIIIVTGDRKIELPGRVSQNLLFMDAMNINGNKVEVNELGGFDHGTMLSPSFKLLLKMIKK